VLDHLAVLVESEDVDPGVLIVTRRQTWWQCGTT